MNSVAVQLEQFTESLQTINRFVRSRTFDRQSRAVTRVQWTLLRMISRTPGQTVGQLAEKLDVRQATMSQMLDRLEKVRFVERLATAQDARVKAVFLTEMGQAQILATEAQWRESLEIPFLQLSPEERSSLVELIRRLAGNISEKGREQ